MIELIFSDTHLQIFVKLPLRDLLYCNLQLPGTTIAYGYLLQYRTDLQYCMLHSIIYDDTVVSILANESFYEGHGAKVQFTRGCRTV